jgi:hypothetical protein
MDCRLNGELFDQKPCWAWGDHLAALKDLSEYLIVPPIPSSCVTSFLEIDEIDQK